MPMGIDFDKARWNQVKKTSRAWWKGELDRPLIQMRLYGRDAGRRNPNLPAKGFTSFYSLETPAELIVDRWDYNLATTQYLADAFPCVWPNFGAGIAAAFLGAELKNNEHTTWFIPPKILEIDEIAFKYDAKNVWLNRIKEIYCAAYELWQGKVLISMTDLGGNLDILSTFRPSEGLLFDLYDHPDHVKRLTWEAHDLWFKFYDEFNKLLAPLNPGYSAWASIFSDVPYYMLQCDFCYMISPKMFDEFVKPELEATCKRLANPFYHLDGPGQLVHLDSLLEIKELKGIQWVPGDGQPGITEWPEVYKKIRNAGKLIQVFGGQSDLGYRALDVLSEQLGDAKGIVMIADASVEEIDEVRAFLRKYGVKDNLI